MKLIPMTDFVLEQGETKAGADLGEYDYYHDEWLILSKIRNYAQFLKQPLTLGMFVPCDEEGNVLTEPDHLKFKHEKFPNELHFISDAHRNRYSNEYDTYTKAREGVLFEGFEKSDSRGEQYPRIKSNILEFVFDQFGVMLSAYDSCDGQRINSIERLTELNISERFPLTNTSRKQIFG